jgi:hypothetical protein
MSTRGSIAIAQECHAASKPRRARVGADCPANASGKPDEGRQERVDRREARRPMLVLESRLCALRLGQGQLALADLVVELVLDLVDLGRARVRLGPEVPRVGRVSAELEADQVILLVVRRRAGESVQRHLLELELRRVARGRADRPRPAVHADRAPDRRLRDVGVERPRRQRRVCEDGRPVGLVVAAACQRREEQRRDDERDCEIEEGELHPINGTNGRAEDKGVRLSWHTFVTVL